MEAQEIAAPCGGARRADHAACGWHERVKREWVLGRSRPKTSTDGSGPGGKPAQRGGRWERCSADGWLGHAKAFQTSSAAQEQPQVGSAADSVIGLIAAVRDRAPPSCYGTGTV